MEKLSPFKKKDIKKASELLKKGFLLAVPTDTVYGLCCVFDDKKAREKMNVLKHRNDSKTYTIALEKNSDIEKFANIKKIKIKRFLKKVLPGYLTVILPAKKNIPNFLLQNKNIGIRVSKCKVLKKIIAILKKPILLTSLNISGEKSLENFDEINDKFGKEIRACVLASEKMKKVVSTIIFFENDKIKILRDGCLSLEYLNNIYEAF